MAEMAEMLFKGFLSQLSQETCAAKREVLIESYKTFLSGEQSTIVMSLHGLGKAVEGIELASGFTPALAAIGGPGITATTPEVIDLFGSDGGDGKKADAAPAPTSTTSE